MDWLLWFGVILLVGATLYVVVRTRPAITPKGGAPESGEATGPISSYLDKIEELSRGTFDTYFVTALDQRDKQLVQVSAKRQENGGWRYQFDVPIMKWSKGFIPILQQEARDWGYDPVVNRTSDGLETLDIFFNDQNVHADFTRWVVREVYGHEARRMYDITWG